MIRKDSRDSVMVKRMLNTLVTRFFYRQVAKAAKKSQKLGALGVLAVVQYHPDEYKIRAILG